MNDDSNVNNLAAGVRGLVANLRAGLALAVFRTPEPGGLHASLLHWLALLGVGIGLRVVLEYLRLPVAAVFNWAALPAEVHGIPWLLLCVWAVCRVAGAPQRFIAGLVAVTALTLWINLLWQTLGMLPPGFWHGLGEYAPILWWAPLLWVYLACIAALVRSCNVRPEGRVGVVLAVTYLLTLPQFLPSERPALWLPRQDRSASDSERERWAPLRHESMLYSQPALLDEALAKIAPGQPAVPELFLLALAGHGAQDVFLREVESVEKLFVARFGTAGRTLLLVNNPVTVHTRPVASVHALSRSLKVIGSRMNADDVLFLFMTSHGSPNHVFDLSLWPYEFDALSPHRLREILDASGIPNKVVLVSACYSGGFVPPLEEANTLVMSAARADRNSHGCSHEADWTFFGRAYFDESLRQTHSFEQAFAMASKAVAQREKDEGFEASEPQISIGGNIGAVLKRVEAVLARP